MRTTKTPRKTKLILCLAQRAFHLGETLCSWCLGGDVFSDIRINRWTDWIDPSESNCTVMAAIYCATQKYTVNSGLGIYDLAGSTRPIVAAQTFSANVGNTA
jgi:hypothetical protein